MILKTIIIIFVGCDEWILATLGGSRFMYTRCLYCFNEFIGK